MPDLIKATRVNVLTKTGDLRTGTSTQLVVVQEAFARLWARARGALWTCEWALGVPWPSRSWLPACMLVGVCKGNLKGGGVSCVDADEEAMVSMVSEWPHKLCQYAEHAQARR